MLFAADDVLLARLQAVLPEAAFKAQTDAYLTEPRGAWRGQAGLVVAPASTEEVASTIRAVAACRAPVVPYGGGTGLVGGQVAPVGPPPLILSLERMTRIRATYPEESVIVVEAGAILADVQAAAETVGRLFPLSLASEGSARIGGLLATNAGGVNVVRYGNARDLCLGVEAVLPSGEIHHGLRRLRKDNTGYDLRHLLIGAEGTLGVITAAALRLYPRPAATGAALLQVTSPAAALALLGVAQARASDGLSAFELISGQGLRFLEETLPQVRRPFETPPDWMVLIDLGMPPGRDPQAVLEEIFAEGLDQGLTEDGLIAQSEEQRAQFWAVRETIPEANRLIGAVSSHDISVPLGRIADFIEEAPKRLAGIGAFRINCFGHLGDGNLHYNVYPLPGERKADRAGDKAPVQEAIHDLVHEMEGSISAEHGIGRLKAADLERYGDPAKLAAMRAIKAALDPLGIMNPGAVLRV